MAKRTPFCKKVTESYVMSPYALGSFDRDFTSLFYPITGYLAVEGRQGVYRRVIEQIIANKGEDGVWKLEQKQYDQYYTFNDKEICIFCGKEFDDKESFICNQCYAKIKDRLNKK